VLLVLTVYEENEYIFEALCAGADGYLLKSTQPRDLLSCVHQAIAGGAPMSPGVAARVIRLFRKVRPRAEFVSDLTPHEVRILTLLANGENYKTAAALLKVGVNTISFHVRNIYSKLHVHSRSDAVAKAIRRGLIS
jgi:DNA-binding NarL/FixJ family response regulator